RMAASSRRCDLYRGRGSPGPLSRLAGSAPPEASHGVGALAGSFSDRDRRSGGIPSVILGLHVEVVLALAYALFLGGVAFLLERVARKSHKRAEEYRNAGFTYFRELDYFECPGGHKLVQLNTDQERRITAYRAPSSACNSCALKHNCTDSEDGR